jgi:tetratricopeptide (TPR) repeat protein
MKHLTLVLLIFCLSFSLTSQNFEQYYSNGVRASEEEKFNEAIEFFSKAIEKKNLITNTYKIADAYIGRGISRLNLGSTDRSIEDFETASELAPEYSKPFYLLAIAYLEQKKADLAHKAVDRSLDIKPNQLHAMEIKSKIYAFEKRYNEEVTLRTKMIEMDVTSAHQYKMRGNAYQMQKKYENAISDFTKAIELDQKDIASWFDRGLCYAEKKEFDKAVSDIEQAVKIDSTQAFIAYNNIAYFVKFEQKDWKGAIEYFDKALAQNPTFAYAYSNRGYAKYMLGNNSDASKDIRKSIELDATNSYAFKNYALVLLAEGKRKDACTQLERAQKLGYTQMYDNEVNELQQKNCK